MGPNGERGSRYPVIYLALVAALLIYHGWRWVRAEPLPEAAETPGGPAADAPLVSFLVPAWNAADDVAGFVEAFLELGYPHKELILCVGGRDGGFKVAQSFRGDGVKVLEQRPGEGKQRALAKSFLESRGRVIYLTDIDCRLDTASVWRVLEPIIGGREAVVTGLSHPLAYQREVGAVLVHWAVERKAAGLRARPVDGLLGRNCAVTREAVKAIGAFTHEAPTGTDYRMAQRLQAQGYRIWFEPASDVPTAFAWPWAVYVRKQARWLRNVILYAELPRQAAEYGGALFVLATPYVLMSLFLASLVFGSAVPAFLGLLLLLHATLNRWHYVHETLAARYLRVAIVPGSLFNLLATLAAGIYTSVTLLTPALRKQW